MTDREIERRYASPAEVGSQSDRLVYRILSQRLTSEDLADECRLGDEIATTLARYIGDGIEPGPAIHRALQRVEAGIAVALVKVQIGEIHYHHARIEYPGRA